MNTEYSFWIYGEYRTVINWLPSLISLLIFLPFCVKWGKPKRDFHSKCWFCVTKQISVNLLFILAVSRQITFTSIDVTNNDVIIENVIGSILLCITFFIVLMVSMVSMCPSGSFQILTCSMIAVFGLPELCVRIWLIIEVHLSIAVKLDDAAFILQFALCCAVAILFSISHFHPSEQNKVNNNVWPHRNRSFTNRIFVCYMWPLLLKGYRQRLTIDDLWKLDQAETAEDSYLEFMKRYSNDKSLALTLVRIHWKSLLISGFLFFLFHMCTVLNIIIVLSSIRLAMNTDEPRWHGLVYMAAFFIALLIRNTCLDYHFYHMHTIGVRCRSAMSIAIYRKALRLSPNARRQFTSGQIQNLVSVDAEWFCIGTANLHLIWGAPLRFIISIYYLYYLAGHAAWPGILITAVMASSSLFISKYLRIFLTKQMMDKDSRIYAMAEMVKNILLIKLFAWEPSFQTIIERIRTVEISYLKFGTYIAGFSEILLTSIVPVACMSIIGTYNWINDTVITPKIAFGVIASFNAMYVPLIWLSTTINCAMTTTVVLRRLKRFLVAEELNNSISNASLGHQTGEIHGVISIMHSTFKWDHTANFQLQDIDMQVEQGKLVAIVGPVGSGKSSLLNALIGEMYLINGSVNLTGTVAYVPQNAWILNDTFRQNVTFGKEYQKEKYDRILRCCCLEQDLATLIDGDMTEIGERGITLSGGQKQRLSLARAAYQDRDIYLLDDPLSAVDVHVRRSLFDNLIGPNGLLKSKTRVLVTHSLSFLSQCDHVIVMEKGKIIDQGSYDELCQNNIIDQAQSSEREGMPDDGTDRTLNKVPLNGGSPVISILGKPNGDEAPPLNAFWTALKLYSKASGCALLGFCIFVSLSFACWTGVIFFLQKWTDSTILPHAKSISTETGLKVIGIFVSAQVILAIFFIIFRAIFSSSASERIHSNLLKSLLHAPVSFFDITPTGRILSRYGKDINTVDNQIPQGLAKVVQYTALLLLSMVPCIYATPLFLVILIPSVIAFGITMRFFARSSKQFRQLEASTRSPVYTRLQETLRGFDSIRAYGKIEQFCDQQNALINENARTIFTLQTAQRWSNTVTKFLGAVLVTAAGLLAVLKLSTDGLSPGMMGMSLVSVFQLLELITWFAWEIIGLDTEIVALDRVNKYLHVKPEAPWTTEKGNALKGWPNKGRIEIKNYSIRYRPHLPMALSNVNLIIESGQKVGVVGRTGAGKSTFTMALFRIVEPAHGSILIDDVDISGLGLHELRRQLTIIPQEPCLFSGTLRRNLDPFNEYSDDALWFALQSCHLKEYVANLPGGLQTAVEEGGVNLSTGQRQLLCMARAITRNSKILILDEATASVDLETDSWIQDTLRSQFSQCTVITVAHRLSTILDYDMILVMENGGVSEFAPTKHLLADENSAFRKMVVEAGLKIIINN